MIRNIRLSIIALIKNQISLKLTGPKSLAGLNPAWVKGAITDINAPTVAPIRGGIKFELSDIVLLFLFVKAKITNARIPVPNASAKKAVFQDDTL